MNARRSFRAFASLTIALFGLAGLAAAPSAVAAPPPRASDPVPDPGKSTAGVEDTAAIAVNPANLVFLPSPELRWNLVWTGSTSTLANRGTSIGLGVPIGPFATGLRLDFLDPPRAAPAPFDASYRWVRWALALGSDDLSIGTTFGWGSSESLLLHDYFSITSGVTWRPLPWLGASYVLRDWNEPRSKAGLDIERSHVWGLALRPFSTRALEAAFDVGYFEKSQSVTARATLGIDVPRVGRLRGDVTVFPGSDGAGRRFVAMAGVDVNIDRFQVSAGGVFGDAITPSGTGFYAGAALRGFREPGVPKPAHVARLKINGTPGVRGHMRLLKKLWRLADDPEVEGVVLQIRDEPASSLAHAEELGDALRTLRVRGKKVLCHLEDAGGRSLFVCSQADRIAMNPAGGLRFGGLALRYLYFGGVLRKLNVRADFVRIGAHKLAAEQFTNEGGSAVAQVDHQELLREIEKVYLHDVGGGRRIPLDELSRAIAKGPFIAPEAKAAKLIDTLAYEDEIDRVVEEMMGRRARITDASETQRAPERWGKVPKVAVVYLSGDMVDGESQSIPLVGIRLAGSRTIASALKRAREDSTVKSVVFRIETGGGSSLAADVILREAILTARAKPLIVSMGSSAASGGYYASVAGREIYANRTTITGSIGIFYGKVDVSGLLSKLGVGVESYRTAPRADAESFFRPFTDAERRELGVKVKQFYDLFVGRVAEGRHMTPEAVDAVARGKVWTGAQALPLNLVTKLGGIRQALDEARKLGGLERDAPIVEWPEDDESLLGFLFSLVGISAAGISPQAAAALPPAFREVARSLAPFLVFEPSKALARAEFFEEDSSEEP